MIIADHFNNNHISCEEKEYLFFSGTSYLGMNYNLLFRELINEGMGKYGNNYGSSRNSNFRLKVYEEAESALALFTGAPAALTVSSGFMAGQLVVNMLQEDNYFVFAPNTHPAVCRRRADFYEGDFQRWTEEIAGVTATLQADKIVIVCNSNDPLFCRPYSFDGVLSLPGNKEITLVIDDSHGIGVMGEHGQSIYKKIRRRENVNLIVVASLAKAMGIPGGVILGAAGTIGQLRTSSFFGTSSPMAPGYLYAFTKAGQVYDDARKQFSENIRLFNSLIPNRDLFDALADYPVFYTARHSLSDFLSQHGVLISGFAYRDRKERSLRGLS
ncbi:MAG: aminotransferase class I/II-fold pyridoxal phosphate-dependent enzyme [Sphingobacteriales bacterium]|nr:aminotransferase class I/II-fold pyridoxal phosphate-dependent enzyme [Sphingobacteriales bacterium]